MSESEQKDVLTADGAAALLNVSRATVYNSARAGKLPGQKVSQQWRFSRKGLFVWMDLGDTNLPVEIVLPESRASHGDPAAAIMDVHAAADYFHIPVSVVYRAAQTGQVPARKIAGQWRFSRVAIGRWMCHPWRFPVGAAYALDDRVFEDEIWRIAQVADFLRVSVSTIYQAASSGKMPGQKVGRQWRFSKLAINLWLCGCLTEGGEAS